MRYKNEFIKFRFSFFFQKNVEVFYTCFFIFCYFVFVKPHDVTKICEEIEMF